MSIGDASVPWPIRLITWSLALQMFFQYSVIITILEFCHSNIQYLMAYYVLLVSSMAKELRCSLAKWKVPGLNLTMGKFQKSFGKKKFQLKSFRKKSQPSSACMMEIQMTGVLLTHKKAGVCAIMSIWLVHIKEHVWTVGTCPTTILLSTITMCECVCEWQHWRRL